MSSPPPPRLVLYVSPPWPLTDDHATHSSSIPLLSRSPDCLAALFYLRLLKVDFDIDQTCQPLMSPTGELPAMQVIAEQRGGRWCGDDRQGMG